MRYEDSYGMKISLYVNGKSREFQYQRYVRVQVQFCEKHVGKIFASFVLKPTCAITYSSESFHELIYLSQRK